MKYNTLNILYPSLSIILLKLYLIFPINKMSEVDTILDDIYPILKTTLEMMSTNGYKLGLDELKIVEDSGDDYSLKNQTYQNGFILPYSLIYQQLKTEKKNATVYDLFTKKYQKSGDLDT